MAYKTFLQRLTESTEVTVELEPKDKPEGKEGKEGGELEGAAEDFHEMAKEIVGEEFAAAFAEGDTADAYSALLTAVRAMHAIVCPDEDLEAEDEKLTEAEGPQQLKQVHEFFPSTFMKAATALANRGDLFLGDTEIKVIRGKLAPEAGALSSFNSLIELEIQGEYVEIPVVGEVSEVLASHYDARNDELEAVAEFSIDESDFWDEFEKQFQRIVHTAFDDSNPDHERTANRIHRQFLMNPCVLVTVDSDGVDVSDVLDADARTREMKRLSR